MRLNVHVIISGKVQGVWFRVSTKQKAEQLGINGWVKNTHEGDVEAILQGEEEPVKEMIEWCRHGPALAKVKKVKIKNKTQTRIFDGFHIIY
ncbi:MAG: acylphosphatase [Thermoplasmatales archaeon]|nr:MAG: acylphosphatase [Thermoplasmatales archaeon]